jgi:hypothetical protein
MSPLTDSEDKTMITNIFDMTTAADTCEAIADIIAGALAPEPRAAAVANTLREAGRVAISQPITPFDLLAGLICIEGHYDGAGDARTHLANSGAAPAVVADLSDPAVAARAKTIREMVAALSEPIMYYSCGRGYGKSFVLSHGIPSGGTIAKCAAVWRAMADSAAKRADDARAASIAVTWAREAAMLESGLLLTGYPVDED